MMAPARFMMAPLWGKSGPNGIRDVGSSKETPQRDVLVGAHRRIFSLAELPAQFHGLAFSYIGEKSDLASAVDLHAKPALMFRA